MERMHRLTMNEIESENKCNRLLITKLEDELILLRKCEARNVSNEFYYQQRGGANMHDFL